MMVTEAEIHQKLFEHLSNEEGIKIKSEVPLFLKRIDIVTVSPKEDTIKAYEVKIKDWKRAFKQAKISSLCADETYVALWHKYTHRIDLDLFKTYGIGVYGIDGTVELILKSNKKRDIDEEARKIVREFVLREGC